MPEEKNRAPKPKYNLFQMSWWMVRRAAKHSMTVLPYAAALILCQVALNLLELLAGPAVIRQVEQGAPLGELLMTIGLFTGGLMLCAGGRDYFEQNSLFGRIQVRSSINNDLHLKFCRTSYPNTQDPGFLARAEKAKSTTNNNRAPSEYFWTILVELLQNLVTFILWLVLLSALNPAVVAVVLVLCMVGLLIASPFGLFFSGAEGNGSGVPQAVAQLNGEFTARIEQIKEETPHDVLDLDNDAITAVLDNWRNILAVYAVRASADGSSPNGLDGLTAENLALLWEVFWDMNQISSFTETVPKGEDETETILHITAVVKTPQEMATEYGFTDGQKELLEELLKPEYQELFQTLIGSSQDLTLSIEQVQEILDSLPEDLSEERRQVILTAYQLLGKVNYFWGGKSLVLGWDSRWGTPKEVWAAGSPSTGTVRPYGLDCSGFVDWVFYNVSGGTYIIGHGGGAHMQHTYCTPITWDEAIPGDLVFYPEDTHVGIVCGFDSDGNVQIIHCASGANNVVVTGKSGFTTIARPNYYSS